MATATTGPTNPSRPSATHDRRDQRQIVRISEPSGFYDPDGAGWEAEPPMPSEPVRPPAVRAPIVVELNAPDRD